MIKAQLQHKKSFSKSGLILFRDKEEVEVGLSAQARPNIPTNKTRTIVAGLDALQVRPAETEIASNVQNPEAQNSVSFKRFSSTDTHREYGEKWVRPVARGSPEDITALIGEVFNTTYSPAAGDEPYHLPLKRAFHTIDMNGQGWLARTTVEQVLSNAAAEIGVPLERTTISSYIKTEDETTGMSNFQIDVDKFVNIALKLRQHVCDMNQRLSEVRGVQLAKQSISSWQDHNGYKSISPLWQELEKKHKGEENHKVVEKPWYHQLGGFLKGGGTPCSRNMTNALFLATEYCVDEIQHASQTLYQFLRDVDLDTRNEIQKPLDTLLQLATRFHQFDYQENEGCLHWLDSFLESAFIVPVAEESSLADCPFHIVLSLRQRIWNVLDILLGIIREISYSNHPKITVLCNSNVSQGSNPSLMHTWRQKQLSRRIQELFYQHEACFDNTAVSEYASIKTWVDNHSFLDDHREACLETTNALRRCQEQGKYSQITVSIQLRPLPKKIVLRQSVLLALEIVTDLVNVQVHQKLAVTSQSTT